MNDDGRAQAAGSAEHLQQLLGRLGREAAPTLDVPAEKQREARVSSHIDAELAALVASERKARRRLLLKLVLAAAAIAAALAGLGPRGGGSLPIAQEPPPSRTSSPPERAVGPAVSNTPSPSPAPDNAARSAPRSSIPSPRLPVVSVPKPSSSPEPESTLAEENQLFKRAADASRRGDAEAALQALDSLLEQYPKSPLAQTALVRKFRLLAKSGRNAQAKREAERYLSTYPSGFALREAESVARGASMSSAPSPPASAEVP